MNHVSPEGMLVTGDEPATTDTPLSTVSATPGDAGEATQHHTAAARLLPAGAEPLGHGSG